MPLKYDRCVKEVSKKIRRGKIRKTYMKEGKRLKTSPYAICSRLRKK